MRTHMHDQLELLLYRDQKVPTIVIALTREGYGVVYFSRKCNSKWTLFLTYSIKISLHRTCTPKRGQKMTATGNSSRSSWSQTSAALLRIFRSQLSASFMCSTARL